MTDISKNTELQQSCITAVKSRFFAQYWGQEVGLQCEGVGKGFTYTISDGSLKLLIKKYHPKYYIEHRNMVMSITLAKDLGFV